MVGQMYAEFWIPQTLRCPYPVVMIHGNWQTGTNFTGTPDGREGWAQYFLRRGYAVYVVDQVARGRSAHFSHVAGRGRRGRPRAHRAALRRAEALRTLAAGEAPHPVAGSGKAGRQVFRRVLRDAVPVAGRQREVAGDQPRRRGRAARQDRPRDRADAFAIGRLRLADRRRAAEAGEGTDRRSSRTARRSTRPTSRARRTGSTTSARARPTASAWCRWPTIRRSSPARNWRSCARRSPTRRTWCAAGCRPSRRASCRTSPKSRC